jgi:O-antigen/teichoic acid export membrane protein
MPKLSASMGGALFLLTAAKVWVTALAILVVPLYLKYLGIEAYGVIGFFAAMQSALVVFDLGLSTTITKNLAQLRQQNAEIQNSRDLLRSSETVYGLIALIVITLFLLLSPLISSHWFLPTTKGEVNKTLVVFLAACALAAQWPTALYSAALNGLHQIKALSIVLAIFAVVRVGLAVLAAWFTSDLSSFFAAHLLGSSLQTLLLRHLTWKHLKLDGHQPKFSKKILMQSASFTGDIALITVFSVALTQGDKLLLSQRLSLSDFGIYALAATAASGLYVLVNPFSTTIFPYFSRLVAGKDEVVSALAYRRASELLACGLVPMAMVLMVMSQQVLWVWTGDMELAKRAAQVLSILSAGTMLNGFLQTPYAYQIAKGETKLSLWMNGITLIITMPALWFSSAAYGIHGAALVWFAINLGLLVVWPYCMHQSMLKEQMLWWYSRAITLPIVSSVSLTVLIAHFLPDYKSRTTMFFMLLVIVGANFILSIFILPNARRSIGQYFGGKKKV